jgi:hypothetical protein
LIFCLRKRYKIATEALARYISDWNIVYYFIAKWIEESADRKSPTRSREESDFYEYCVGHVRMVNLRNKLGLEHPQILKSMEEENEKHKPQYKESTHEKEEMVNNKKFDPIKCSKEKLEGMRANPEYIEIRRNFPILYEIFTKPVRNILEGLEMNDLAPY